MAMTKTLTDPYDYADCQSFDCDDRTDLFLSEDGKLVPEDGWFGGPIIERDASTVVIYICPKCLKKGIENDRRQTTD